MCALSQTENAAAVAAVLLQHREPRTIYGTWPCSGCRAAVALPARVVCGLRYLLK